MLNCCKVMPFILKFSCTFTDVELLNRSSKLRDVRLSVVFALRYVDLIPFQTVHKIPRYRNLYIKYKAVTYIMKYQKSRERLKVSRSFLDCEFVCNNQSDFGVFYDSVYDDIVTIYSFTQKSSCNPNFNFK